jgi:DNA mismatch repair protein MutH
MVTATGMDMVTGMAMAMDIMDMATMGTATMDMVTMDIPITDMVGAILIGAGAGVRLGGQDITAMGIRMRMVPVGITTTPTHTTTRRMSTNTRPTSIHQRIPRLAQSDRRLPLLLRQA